jgi:hypothetical protein
MAVEGLYLVHLFPPPLSSVPFVHAMLVLTDLRSCQTMVLFKVLGSLMFRYSSYSMFFHAGFFVVRSSLVLVRLGFQEVHLHSSVF